MRRQLLRLLTTAAAVAGFAAPALAETLTACPTGAKAATCRFTGDKAIQAAVDAARDGDTILIKAGRYVPAATRDVPFQDLVVRGMVVISGKRLAITGEDGAVLDGEKGVRSSAFVLDRAEVSFRNLSIRGFRYAMQEDDVYDGHGVFAIDSRMRLDHVRFDDMVKMCVIGRGASLIDATWLRLTGCHVGFWLEESAHANVRDSVIRDGETAGVAIYGNATFNLYNSLVQGYEDDGVYAKGDARAFVSHSLILDNKPYGLNAEGRARVLVEHSVVHGNAKAANHGPNDTLVLYGEGVSEQDPLLDAQGKPRPGSPLIGRKDPIGPTGGAR